METQETPIQESSVQETPVQESPIQESPIQESPIQEIEPQEIESQKQPDQEPLFDMKQMAQMNQEEIIDYVRTQVESAPINTLKDLIDFAKKIFYKQQEQQTDTNAEEIESGSETANNTSNEEDDATREAAALAEQERRIQRAELEKAFKNVISTYNTKKAEFKAAIDAEYERNLAAKKDIIAQLKTLIDSEADLNETISQFRELQNTWKTIGPVSQTEVNDIWKEYNHYQEQFYDLIKIRTELREYDFKKNLEAKNALIAKAEELTHGDDVIKAFQCLQNLHNEWREIGPVDKEIRDEIWGRFKELSTIINKRHQDYFIAIKEEEARLTKEREEAIQSIESIDFTTLSSYKDWDEKTAEVIATNELFKSNTTAERRVNGRLFKRYRGACDMFFEAKNQFYKAVKETLNANYEKKRRLTEQAEQLKNSHDWKATTDRLIELQKEWKTIGPVQKKYSDAIWERFTAACDHFFAQKEENFKSKKIEEQENLRQKLEAIETIKAYQFTGNDEEDFSALRRLSDQYLAIGHIPFKEKDAVYKAYKDASAEQFNKLRARRRSAQLSFAGDRNKLMRQYESLKQQIATYENNIGFFSNNKKSNAMVKELERKIENLKQDLAIIIDQIKETEEK